MTEPMKIKEEMKYIKYGVEAVKNEYGNEGKEALLEVLKNNSDLSKKLYERCKKIYDIAKTKQTSFSLSVHSSRSAEEIQANEANNEHKAKSCK